MDSLNVSLILIPALPLLGAIVTAVLGPRILRDKSHFPIVAALAGSFLFSLLLLRDVSHRQAATPDKALAGSGFEQVITLWNWADIGDAYSLPRPAGDVPTKSLDEGLRNFRVDITLRADALTSMMLCMVTFISTLVAIFASGYMHGERGYWRFFSYIGLFVFSMTMLVSVSNFVLLFVFWEAVGACSYLLIGFWYQKPEAAAAGMKAFLVNRVGDFGFACALFLIWTTYGTLNFHDSLASGETDAAAIVAVLESKSPAGASPSDQPKTDAEVKPVLIRGVLGRARVIANDYRTGGVALAICLLLMLGACGKSAQFPLHVWLPDAMEGPTPVSALIHAATMVTAGVYMVTRCSPLFFASPEAQLTVAIIGGFTALLAGLIALTQWDLKRVLAYSTVSQLGYMFVGLGVGTFAGVTSGMFHLFTHAFFKALLFLGSGSVMLAMGHIIDMRQFGGLRKLMPITHATFLVGCLALAGVFPLAGFWSKDNILGSVHDKMHQLQHELEHRHEAAAAHHASHHDGKEEHKPSPFANWNESRVAYYHRVYSILYWSAIFTAFLTAFYTFRAYCLTFWGEERIPEAAHHHGHHPHESPPAMTVPLIVLAVCAAFVGVAFLSLDKGLGYNSLVDFLGNAPSLAAPVVEATRDMTPEFHGGVAAFSSIVAGAGILLALVMYLGHHKEAAFMEGLTDLRGSRKLLDFAWIERLRKIGWIGAAANSLEKIGLGFLVTIAGYLIGLVALILMIPLLLARVATPFKLSQNKFYFDEIYNALFVLPLEIAAEVLAWLDRNLIDRLVDLVGAVPRVAGDTMRHMQWGLVQFYGLVMVLAVITLFVALTWI